MKPEWRIHAYYISALTAMLIALVAVWFVRGPSNPRGDLCENHRKLLFATTESDRAEAGGRLSWTIDAAVTHFKFDQLSRMEKYPQFNCKDCDEMFDRTLSRRSQR